MSSVFREVTIAWNGEDHKIKPEMRLLNRIEDKVSLARLVNRTVNGDVPITQLAYVIAEFLRFDGVQVEDEDVYATLMTCDASQQQAMFSAVIEAVFPRTGGEEEAPAKKKPGTKRQRKT